MTTFHTPTISNDKMNYLNYAEGRIVDVKWEDPNDHSKPALLWFEGCDKPVRKPGNWTPELILDDESYFVASWQKSFKRDKEGRIVPKSYFTITTLGEYDEAVELLGTLS